ncbi:UDP-2,3-diacylglucosamine diphosphatase [Burkholderia sp. SRS-46]|nr:UDP-2,3-diacylglucosamine diphosphatase [Burkholderia sp. SRS-46]
MRWVSECPAAPRPRVHRLRGIILLLRVGGFAGHRRAPGGPVSIASAVSHRARRTDDASSQAPCDTVTRSKPVRVRTLFVSDIHLGTRGCQAELLLEFLRHYEASTIFLVGDIVEAWRLTSDRPWPEQQRGVAFELLTKARNGARVIYVPGNHDCLLRQYAGLSFGGIEITPNALHEAADGRRYLVTHGDEFDAVLRHMPWLASLGHVAYHALLAVNTIVNVARRGFGLDHWSLSAWAKQKVKRAVNYISQFEESLSAEARRQNVHGVVCGHIHHAADHDLEGVRYLNTGDWVESCSGIVEHENGRFELVRWAGAGRKRHSGIGRLRTRLSRVWRPPERAPLNTEDVTGRS